MDQTIYNLELDNSSICINAGDPNFPLDQDGSASDIGAYYIYYLSHNLKEKKSNDEDGS